MQIEEVAPAVARRQRTLKQPIFCRGVGLHSGKPVSLTLRPAKIGHGIVFRRLDIRGPAAIVPASIDNLKDDRLATTLGNDEGVSVRTVEHLLAALAGLEIDNVLLEMMGEEVPAMDGSAADFAFLIRCAGILEQAAPRRYIALRRPIGVSEGERRAVLMPADTPSIHYRIDFANPAIGSQSCDVTLDPANFERVLAPARTFGFASDLERLTAGGLARGASLANAVVVAGSRVMNPEGLRFADEFVRHKALDALGDLALAGAPILGRLKAERAGHSLHVALVRALLSDRRAWSFVERPADATAGGNLAQAAAGD